VTPVTESTSTLNMSCHSGSPQSARLSGRRSTPNSLLPTSGAKTTGRLVDISGGDNDDEEDVAVTQFGRLKVGFTPGMDSNHRSRRVRALLHHAACINLLLWLVIQLCDWRASFRVWNTL